MEMEKSDFLFPHQLLLTCLRAGSFTALAGLTDRKKNFVCLGVVLAMTGTLTVYEQSKKEVSEQPVLT